MSAAAPEPDPIPPLPGTYALVLRADAQAPVTIGAKGRMRLQPGYYLYVGSALGPGGVRGRVAHHRRPAAHPRWHIDYLRRRLPLIEIWYANGRTRYEHRWARALNALAGVGIPMPGFGASDCSCPSHLYYFAERPNLRLFEAALNTRNAVPATHTPGSAPLMHRVHCRGR